MGVLEPVMNQFYAKFRLAVIPPQKWFKPEFPNISLHNQHLKMKDLEFFKAQYEIEQELLNSNNETNPFVVNGFLNGPNILPIPNEQQGDRYCAHADTPGGGGGTMIC